MAIKVIKNKGKVVNAYELGSGHAKEAEMIQAGKIVNRGDGTYELFSQEAKSGSGQIAKAGDFFKIDGSGYPYPNDRAWFEANHRHISGDEYEQLPKPLDAWAVGAGQSDAIDYLLKSKKLVIDEENESEYFGAMLWGSWLTAAKDAVVVFYGVTRNTAGEVTDVDFNFVARSEFSMTYSYVK